jgi:hypothetical protein|tara:strand:- start:320 stop:1393 length:1074 start_codon:yes stop_codon:yes gene_type:complete
MKSKIGLISLCIIFIASCEVNDSNEKPRDEKLDHIAVWSANWRDSAKFLEDYIGWDLHPIIFGAAGESVGDMELVFVNGNGLWIELVEPTSEGPGTDLLELLGDGAVVELDFQSENYQKSLDAALESNLQMLGMDGLPLKDRGRIIDGIIDPNTDGPLPDEYIAYFPYELTGGTAVEIYERNDGDTENILAQRDRMWEIEKLNQPINQNQPKTRYLTILVEDIETVRNFYKDNILLSDFGSIVDWKGHKLSVIDAEGVYEEKIYIRLVQPVVNDQIMNVFKQKGSGHVLEIGIEVSSLEDFKQRISLISENIKMADLSGKDHDAGNPWTVDDLMKENYFYIPSDLSYGMSLKIFEKR